MSTLPFEPVTTHLILTDTERYALLLALQETWHRWSRRNTSNPEVWAMLSAMEGLITRLQHQ